MKGFKAFEKNMQCKGFQFAIGETYKTEKAKICESGFHFCTNPLDVLNYYDLVESNFCEVEALGNTEGHTEDSKQTTTKIKIGVNLGLPGFVKASFDFLWDVCKVEPKGLKKLTSKKTNDGGKDYSKLAASGDSSQLAASGGYSQLAASGGYSQLAASGDASKLAASGHYSKLAASGHSSKLAASGHYSQLAASGGSSQLAASGGYSQLAASGHYSQLAASGDASKLAASGHYSKLAASGHSSKLAASGHYSQLAASGDASKLELNGNHSVGMCAGPNSIIKGKKGCWITLAEWNIDGTKNIPVCVKSAQIDGVILKEDVFYKLVNGEFTPS